MMIESINPSEILYTYISLTETNDSQILAIFLQNVGWKP